MTAQDSPEASPNPISDRDASIALGIAGVGLLWLGMGIRGFAKRHDIPLAPTIGRLSELAGVAHLALAFITYAVPEEHLRKPQPSVAETQDPVSSSYLYSAED